MGVGGRQEISKSIANPSSRYTGVKRIDDDDDDDDDDADDDDGSNSSSSSTDVKCQWACEFEGELVGLFATKEAAAVSV